MKSTLWPSFWAVDARAREVQVMLECLTCDGETVVSFDAAEVVDVGRCHVRVRRFAVGAASVAWML